MKLFLDDLRPCPDGWTLVQNYRDCVSLLKGGQVTHLSLDHDLGDDETGTGYDVVCWIEMEIFTNHFSPPIMTIHSANPVGRSRMASAIARIETELNKNENGAQN